MESWKGENPIVFIILNLMRCTCSDRSDASRNKIGQHVTGFCSKLAHKTSLSSIMNPSTGILSPGWTEHVGPLLHRNPLYLLYLLTLPGPGGQPYFYNTQTRESTYIRPIIAVQSTTKKKEKPLVKTHIPGTEWLRVITSEGHTFYSHKLKKESVWVIPEEIRSAVEGLQTEERRQQVTEDSISVNSKKKRKAEIPLVGDETVVNKKAKINDDDGDDEDDGDNDEETSEDGDWQRQAAEQLAAEAEEEERKRVEAEMEKEKNEEVQRVRAAAEIIMPQKVDLSIEEGKALFKVSLTLLAHQLSEI